MAFRLSTGVVSAALRPRTLVQLSRPAVVSFSAGLHTSHTSLYDYKNTSDTSGLSHWKIERGLSVALVGLIPAAFITPGPFVDYSLALAIPLHNYLGMDVVFTDYVKDGFKPVAKFLNATVHILTVGSLLYFNAHDVGICEGLKTIWSLGSA
eukprot:m.8466 g.8466  ORF g.8466 m.8466 type:complete len:152 (-) comp5455_c0_seq1:219-674(-)